MKYRDPIRIYFLPDWLVRAVGRATVESADDISTILDEVKDVREDFNKMASTWMAFQTWLYGTTNPFVNYDMDKEVIFFGLDPEPLSDIMKISDSKNLLKSIYGPHSDNSKIESKKDRFNMLCRTFEDVRIRPMSNGDMVLYYQKDSTEYYSRRRLLRTIIKHLIDTIGFKDTCKTQLFKSYLSSSYKGEDEIKHVLAHRVG